MDLAEDRSWAREEAKWRLLLELGGGYGLDDGGGGLAGCVFVTEVAPGLVVVGMLLVARRHGGRGLGRRLMEEALGAAGGRTAFLYATEEGRPLYAKLGFRVVGEVIAHVGVFRRAGVLQPAVGQRTAAAGDLPALARIDRQGFSADRSMLLCRLFAFAGRVVIAAGGYAAAWDNLGIVHAGPLVADSVTTAKALLEAVLPSGTTTARVDLHSDAAAALGGWLSGRGLAPRPPSPLMVRGQDLPWNRAMVLSPVMQALG
jgi:GNAT superfamily N-acetyltransferase